MKIRLLGIILISNLLISSNFAQSFTDPRDGKVYPTVTIGEFTWFAKNLNYEAEGSYCYGDDQKNCEKMGRLYKWEIAISACPPGWHLSTEYEWQQLELDLGMVFKELAYTQNRGVNEGGKMKPGGESRLNILYGGWRRKDGGYRAIGNNAALWTSTEADLNHAWHRDVDQGDDFVYRSRVVKSYSLSCRCVQNYNTTDVPEDN